MDESSYSVFGGLTGAAIGSVIPGVGTLIGGLVGGALGSIGGMFGSSHRRKKERQQLLELQRKQEETLRQKLKADTADLYSSVQSAVSQTSGAMGALY